MWIYIRLKTYEEMGFVSLWGLNDTQKLRKWFWFTFKS